MLDNSSNQPPKFRTKTWDEINDDVRGTYNKDSQIRFKISMLKSSLCDYSDAYVLAVGTITNDGAGADDNEKRVDERNKGVIFKNCSPFTDWINEINNAQIDHAKELDVVMQMYNSTENSNNYSKTAGSLW